MLLPGPQACSEVTWKKTQTCKVKTLGSLVRSLRSLGCSNLMMFYFVSTILSLCPGYIHSFKFLKLKSKGRSRIFFGTYGGNRPSKNIAVLILRERTASQITESQQHSQKGQTAYRMKDCRNSMALIPWPQFLLLCNMPTMFLCPFLNQLMF